MAPKTKLKPTTVYFEPRLLQAAKLKAALTGRNVSQLANEALARRLKEDESDLALMRARSKEPVRSYEDVLKDLKKDGLI